jgi:hypothetical protein
MSPTIFYVRGLLEGVGGLLLSVSLHLHAELAASLHALLVNSEQRYHASPTIIDEMCTFISIDQMPQKDVVGQAWSYPDSGSFMFTGCPRLPLRRSSPPGEPTLCVPAVIPSNCISGINCTFLRHFLFGILARRCRCSLRVSNRRKSHHVEHHLNRQHGREGRYANKAPV